jgi:hypothetical protein
VSGPTQPRPAGAGSGSDGGGLAAIVAPEGVAAVLSILVVVALLSARLAFAGSSGGTPSPSPTAAPTEAPTPSPAAVDVVAIRALQNVNIYLLEQGSNLKADLVPPPVVPTNIRSLFAQISIQLIVGQPAAARLAATPDGASVGKALGEVYTELDQTIEATNAISLVSEPKWRAAAAEVVKILERIPPLDAQLSQLLPGSAVSPSPGGSASPSAGPSVAPSPTAVPSASLPSPTPTATPTASPPSPTPTSTTPPPTFTPTPSPGPNPLVNPGFESGVIAPWTLMVTDPAAAATVAVDGSVHHSGSFSARVDISAPSGRRAGIALQQGDLAIDAAGIYRVSLYARSSAARDMRVRITSESGQTLGNGTNLFTIGPDWTLLTFEFSSLLGDPAAVFAIELGGGGETVWVDDASIVRIPPGAP